MMGDYTWGDVHHPGLVADGIEIRRPLALRERQREQPHRADRSARLQNAPDSRADSELDAATTAPPSSPRTREYILCATRFSVPLPKGRVADPKDYEKEFNGMVSGIKVDPQTGEMKVGWQILTPPFDWDLGSTGKGPSSGWAFWTSYNTEMAHDTLGSELDAERSRSLRGRELARRRASRRRRQGAR